MIHIEPNANDMGETQKQILNLLIRNIKKKKNRNKKTK
jgi:hypothetical protein